MAETHKPDNRPNRITPPQASAGHLVGELSAGIARARGRQYPTPPRNIVEIERRKRDANRATAPLHAGRAMALELPAATPYKAAMDHIDAAVPGQKMVSDDNRKVHQAAKEVHEWPLKPDERQKLLEEVGGTFRGDVSISVGNKHFGAEDRHGFRAPMDVSTPGRKFDPVREGVSFTPAQIPGHDQVVVMDYQYRDQSNVISYRIPMQEGTANRVLAGTSHVPELPRTIANNLMDTRARGLGSKATEAVFSQNDIGQTQIFDGITTGTPTAETAAHNQGRLFPASESYIQYPARNFDGMYQQ
jgi:hypothetical protein